MTDSPLAQVDEHYLDQVMDLSHVQGVEASQDIYAANGMKLIAKGARLSNEMQERLILHRLKKPLETSISIGTISSWKPSAARTVSRCTWSSSKTNWRTSELARDLILQSEHLRPAEPEAPHPLNALIEAGPMATA